MWNARFFHIKKVYYNFRDRKQYIRLYRDSLKAGGVPIWTPPVLVGCPCVQSFPGGRSSIQELTTRSTVRSLKLKLNANHLLCVILNDLTSLKALSIFLNRRARVMLNILLKVCGKRSSINTLTVIKCDVLLAKIIYHGSLWPKLECINSNDIFRYSYINFLRLGSHHRWIR